MNFKVAFTALLVLILLGIRPASGADAEWLVRGIQAPVSHSSNGFKQTVSPAGEGVWRVHVSCSSTPIGSESPAPAFLPKPGVPGTFRFPRSLEEGFQSGQSAWERGTVILQWVASELRLNREDLRPQDALSVLSRRSGRCSGLANATAALFLAAGYDARTVGGLLITENGPVQHRWLEVRLPKAGWVGTDPTLGFWVLTPRYLCYGRTVELLPSVETLKAPIGDLPFGPSNGVFMRPDRGSSFRCRVIAACGGQLVAVLRDEGGEERRAPLRPDGLFSALLPGRWTLEILKGSRSLRRVSIDIRPGEDSSLAFKLGEQDCS